MLHVRILAVNKATNFLAPLLLTCDIHSFDLQIETRNNKLEMQSVNNKSLIEELDKLLERLRVPSEVPQKS